MGENFQAAFYANLVEEGIYETMVKIDATNFRCYHHDGYCRCILVFEQSIADRHGLRRQVVMHQHIYITSRSSHCI